MEKIYAKGLFAKRNEKAPDFVVCNISIKADEFDKFVKENTNEKGYVNLQVLKSKDKSTLYAVVDTFEPKASTASTEIKKAVKTQDSDPFQNGNSDDDLPF
jgi:hypothetical protein